jgi:hypothetical protein
MEQGDAPEGEAAPALQVEATPPEEEDVIGETEAKGRVTRVQDVSFKDRFFPFSPGFASKPRKERELLFTKAFEEQKLFIRNKEVKSLTTVVEKPLDKQMIDDSIAVRQKFLDEVDASEQRRTITRKEIEFSSRPAERIDVDRTPTFNALLNVNYEDQFSILAKFKEVVSEILLRNRVATRTKDLAQFVMNGAANVVKTLQEEVSENVERSVHSFLSLRIQCERESLSFSEPYHLEGPPVPEVNMGVHKVEKPFKIYEPGLVERYQLTPFQRTDITAYVATPIAPPETFRIVREEQPVRERTVLSLDLDDPMLAKDKPVAEVPSGSPQKLVVHPREVRYYPWDLAYCLRPQPMTLPDLPMEIGRTSIFALTMMEYEKLSTAGKTKAPFGPFEFSGVPKCCKAKLLPMSGPDPIDLKELSADDDIDGIDVQPVVRPITDFISKPLNIKGKSHALAELVSEDQSQWKERQRKGVSEMVDKFKALNALVRDKELALQIDDLVEFTKQ